MIHMNEDEITSLPGLSDAIKFKQYSGYLNASKGRHHFYWFVESESDPQNAPVVLWLTGGPGCSSIFGMITENGPFRANEDGKTLSLHDFAANKVANMVYMESPVSTGFSYDENSRQPRNDDVTTANDNYLALESFFVKYPHLKKNPFYITGESYAGVYIPMLAHEIFKRNSTINLKGLSIGNGLINGGDDSQSSLDFALGHGLITTEYYEKKIEACCECKTGVQHECDFSKAPNRTKCQSVEGSEVSTPNPYNIYDECFPDLDLQKVFNAYSKHHFEKIGLKFAINDGFKYNAKPKCPVNGHTPYLNDPAVQKALHVREGGVHWGACDGNYDRSHGYTSQVETTIELIQKYKIGRFVVYNGDFDIMCDFVTDQRFVDGIAVSTQSKKVGRYHEWSEDGQVSGRIGGFVQHYENGLSFVLARGAGHMVPEDKPEAGLQILKDLVAVNEDEITSLPGLSDAIKFKQYSGYLNASKGRHHFYWFVESESDPQNAPVVLWLTGGPGCSSIFGMITENGPFRANEDGKTLSLHDFAANKVANMVYMESPVSTGFSYDENTRSPHNNDETTANDNYLALESFFVKYPHLKKNPFYITGESYAGVYIPMLAHEIFKRNSTINLKGVAVGNGALNAGHDSQSSLDFALGHGLVTTDWYAKKIEACCECTAGIQHECDFSKAPNKTKCDSVPNVRVSTPNPYNIYDECFPDLNLQEVFNTYHKQHFEKIGLKFSISDGLKQNAKPKCPKNGHTPYLNDPAVQKALHVREGSARWGACNGMSHYQKGADISQVKTTIELIHKYKIGRFVVYNGDFDIVCDFVTDQRFVDGIAVSTQSKKLGSYRKWTEDGKPDGRIGGFVQHYENGLSFVLARDAGHMVPEDRPEAALQILKDLIGISKL
ncbi:unnamed protein product [Medioppia subpectinata]|uniref:Carboxypeptidase n=1 Tax=Medioppia subpectinata TaxID=1979941 RepID=A0A7R9Q1C5_9ACAR|nr:unnamed protein product [Medioppia subpectinata]CAG2108398.1 unnamed protein product [Medioppia subpectinata]